MKSKDLKLLHDKTDAELKLQLSEAVQKIKALLLGKEKPKNVHEVRTLRKDMARILTVLREKELMIKDVEEK